jgi:predicted phosphodiesterase
VTPLEAVDRDKDWDEDWDENVSGMRYLVFGDVHGNLVGLEAVLDEAPRRRVDACLFVGDLVGYGPRPLECIHALAPLHRDHSLAWVAGNHDLAARGDDTTDHFSIEAQETIRWTREQLAANQSAREFIATAGLLTKVAGGIWLTHDSLVHPASGNYHRATENAHAELQHLARRKGRVCFYGHTHTMRAEIMAGNMVTLAPMPPATGSDDDPHPLKLDPDELAWVGTGSVGFPTRQKGEAEYLVLDDSNWTIEKYAVPFSRENARADVHAVLGPVCSKEVVARIVRWL